MIKTFAGKETESLWQRRRCRLPADIQQRSFDKLLLLDSAPDLDFLRFPPGNRLEPLKGEREGQHSIRVNAQWRICFLWTGTDAEDVEICDYH